MNIVIKNNKYNLINDQGKLISDVWFDDVCDFEDRYVSVGLNGKYILI